MAQALSRHLSQAPSPLMRRPSNANIGSVPAVIINDRHLISGGQPVAVFEQALRQIAAQPA